MSEGERDRLILLKIYCFTHLFPHIAPHTYFVKKVQQKKKRQKSERER